jgi:HSP20 family molecular chaperone IbpA
MSRREQVVITAALADAVLTVTVPRGGTGKPRRIQITAD